MIDDMESVTAKLCSFARAYHSNHEKNKIFEKDMLEESLKDKSEIEQARIIAEYNRRKMNK